MSTSSKTSKISDESSGLPLALKNTIFEFEGFLKMELGRSKNTVASYLSDVWQFAEFLASKKISTFESVDADLLVEWIGSISKITKATTQSRKLSAMKSLAGYLVDEKVWSKNYCDIVARPKYRRNVPEVLTANEVAQKIPPKACVIMRCSSLCIVVVCVCQRFVRCRKAILILQKV